MPRSEHENVPVLPAEFLGESAPCLQDIFLIDISFPALPTLLLSTSDLRTLFLSNIPPGGYISPEAMVVGLAALPMLEAIVIEFQTATPRPDRNHQPPGTRTVLPALTYFTFKGASEYLEDLVARIDAPQLIALSVSYLNQLDDFRVAQLRMFVDRTIGPKLASSRSARVEFYGNLVTFRISPHAFDSHLDTPYAITSGLSQGMDWQVSHIAQVLNHFSAALSNVVHLNLELALAEDPQLESTDYVEWLHLFNQFPTVQTLHVSQRIAGHVALVLEDISRDTGAQVLPILNLLYLAGQPASSIDKFVAARRLYDRPVTVIETEAEFVQKLKRYVGK